MTLTLRGDAQTEGTVLEVMTPDVKVHKENSAARVSNLVIFLLCLSKF